MAMKKWFRHLQPLQLYLMLGLTILFFLVQLIMSHMTHALTLLVDSYHMLCNLIALVGCIITIKYGSANVERDENHSSRESLSGDMLSSSKIPSASSCHVHNTTAGCSQHHHHHSHASSSEEKKLKNTFGWARIDVLVMLIGCVFLASLCFSLLVEALQTLVHIGHHDEMHHPIPVMCVGASGLLLNGLCYLLIGGYTFHQGSFLHITSSGDVVLDGIVTKDSVKKGQRQLPAETRIPAPLPQTPQRQGIQEMCRDVSGCVIVIVCSLIVYFTDESIAKFVDPVLSIVSAVLLFVLSYPYMKESGSILLQTIPDTINIDSLRSELLKAFPDIINVHDLHVWRLTATKVFSTAHIIFLNSKDYVRITKDVTEFFHDQGITQVTIQPEFFKMDNRSNLMELPSIHENQCLVQCRELGCHSRHCCSHNDQELTTVMIGSNKSHHHAHDHSHNHSKNHKKYGAAKVKELAAPRKLSEQSDPASACNINMSFETSSCEGSGDECSMHSNVQQRVEDNDMQKSDEKQNVTTSSTHKNTELDTVKNKFQKKYNEQAENTDSTHLEIEQEIVTNDMQKNSEQIEARAGSGYETELNNLQKNVDKETSIHSNLKQEMAAQTNAVQTASAKSELDVVNSEISDSMRSDTTSPVLVPQDSKLNESLPRNPTVSNDSVLSGTVPSVILEKSNTVSPFDSSDAEFSISALPCSVSSDLALTKSNVPYVPINEVVTKPEVDCLKGKTETERESVS